MRSICGRYTITYNGETYNFGELRTALDRRGYVFRTRCDTEVVLNAYIEWGDDCLARMNGMFAFAVWDAATSRSSWLAIDWG